MQRQNQMGRWRWVLAGAALGAVITYFLDPDRGRRRRILLRDKGVRYFHQAQDYSGKMYRDLKNRGQGLIAKTNHRLHEPSSDDWILVDRIKSEIGHHVHRSHVVEIQVNGSEVTLRGPVLAGEVEKLLHSVRRVPGVKNVINHLHVTENTSQKNERTEYLQ